MAGKISGDDDTISEINIVPFVDIILVVLIIFMVATPTIMRKSIQVNLPKAGHGDDTTPSELTIAINKEGVLYLNGKAADEASIGTYAKGLFEKNPDVQAIVSADRDVPHGKVMQIIDSIKAGGVKRFAITIDKK